MFLYNVFSLKFAIHLYPFLTLFIVSLHAEPSRSISNAELFISQPIKTLLTQLAEQ